MKQRKYVLFVVILCDDPDAYCEYASGVAVIL